MKFKCIETPAISHYAYVIADGNCAAVVDPRRDVDDYLAAAREFGCRITHVIETHRQEDFVMGSAYLARLTGARVVNGEHELFGHGDLRLGDGDSFTLGSLKICALHTPGHTPESMCYAVYEKGADIPWGVFTGDTLFFGDTGRSDLPGADKSVENAALLYDSVHGRLKALGDTVLVFPAHGPGSVCGSGMSEKPFSTIGEERRLNDVFTLDRDAFARKKGGERLPRPPYFRLMEKVNLHGGLEPPEVLGAVRFLGPEEFADARKRRQVFDTREPEAFAGGHIADSYSIWLQGLPVFGGWLADETTELLLVGDRGEDMETAALYLSRIGIDRVEGALAGGFGSWRNSGHPFRHNRVITPRELIDRLDEMQVLDVREDGEFDSGHIPGAVHLYVGYLEERLSETGLDRDRTLVVTCGVGHRAGLAVSILLRLGFTDVRNLLGGMKAWGACDFPMDQGGH
ncbi:MBL fold metallo-hydrolase [Microbulbifer rhizosphaerae]|uniref:Hydroxyacylglutathione hydrolase n=1 Tax=Microbulbifer rhizosphaerae TaxID=1562603 RepID=A0A7W4W8C4_9GAMM|nr:MBL fold metallo-hydrolase [Microbulbifer rhizosphaerae]MBB3059508.1 hydroxyacylglutathione hydrolase [Microbulbifer rhizosphaerae]